ncbi:MAG: hypothetical protein AAF702_02440 [Chloroflexota bacterium]
MYLQSLRTIPSLQIHYADQQICIGARGTRLFRSDDQGLHWRPYASLPTSDIHHFTMRFAPYRRLTRGGINFVVNVDGRKNSSPLGETATTEWIAMQGGSLLHVTDGGQQVRPIWDLQRGRRTLCNGLSVWQRTLFIADYWSNPKRQCVHLYRIDLDTAKAEVFYRFEEKTVRHIHNVQLDPYGSHLWLSTGDADHECMILYLNPENGEATCIGQGSQQWRAVSFIFCEDAVFWGTDNPFGENQIWRYDRQSQRVQQIGTVKGPVYYSKDVGPYLLFGTAVEFGHGQQDRYGRLYAAKVCTEPFDSEPSLAAKSQLPSNDTFEAAEGVAEVYRQRKDWLHARYFGYGLFELNHGDVGGNRFWATHKGFTGGLRSTLFELCD